jgi:hypothetical protein
LPTRRKEYVDILTPRRGSSRSRHRGLIELPVLSADSLSGIAAAYVRDIRPQVERELDLYRLAKTDAEAVSRAARCVSVDADGQLRKHRHQWRIPLAAINETERRLNRSVGRLCATRSFADLHELIESMIRGIHKVGELMVYDVSLRIGSRLGLEPTEVYLHRGTREGAVALGLDGRRKTIRVDELPLELRSLRPRELEDLLCIYKSELKRLPRREL